MNKVAKQFDRNSRFQMSKNSVQMFPDLSSANNTYNYTSQNNSVSYKMQKLNSLFDESQRLYGMIGGT